MRNFASSWPLRCMSMKISSEKNRSFQLLAQTYLSVLAGLVLTTGIVPTISPASAQFAPGGVSSPGTSNGAGGDNTGGGAATPGAAGGAALADFGTLINLIQTTVNPDSWDINGGAGTIVQYPAGVYIDPNGRMRRFETDIDLDELLRSGAGESWLGKSGLRTISLRQLDEQLHRAVAEGGRPDAELMNLGGLSRIAFVHVDVVEQDVRIAGPAGQPSVGFRLEDLALLASLVRDETRPLGCSIDPQEAGLRRAQTMLANPKTVKLLARNPKRIVDELADAVGPHAVSVFGMPASSPAALALVDADEHMKKVGFGKAQVRPAVRTYFQCLDDNAVPAQSIVRWWFAYRDTPIGVNKAGDTFKLPGGCVAVMSEKQWMTAVGRAASGGRDPAADKFAEEFTQKLPEIRKTTPAYARLCAIFETALALQLAVDAADEPSLESWFPTLCGLGAFSQSDRPAPKSVDGLATSHKLPSGTTIAVVSGGVQITPSAAAQHVQESKFMAESVLPREPASKPAGQAKWWW